MTVDRLSLRALNRATLQRQLLLHRASMPALDAVDHLVGMQAQVPLNPYVGLWSRLDGFRTDDLAKLLVDREVVRIVAMRGTLHLLTADDCLLLRPLMQPVLDRELVTHRDYGPLLRDVDIEPVLDFVRALVTQRPRSGPELRAAIKDRFPEHDAGAAVFACRNRLAFVQVPPRGVWGETAQVTCTTAESWLGRPVVAHPSIDEVVLRYLAAYGPATVADVASWSRLTGMREVIERLGSQLRTYRDERGRELFDVPDAPMPDPDTPAPPRFLPEYDNALLSHADRSRYVSEKHRGHLSAGSRTVHGSVLYDGFGCGTWRVEDDRASGRATLIVDHVGRLTKKATAALAAEGRRLMRLIAADATTHEVTFLPLD